VKEASISASRILKEQEHLATRKVEGTRIG
jgi:hypothetical protein